MLTSEGSGTMYLEMNFKEVGPVCPVGVALWHAEYSELLNSSSPKALNTIPTVSAQQKSRSSCFFPEIKNKR